MSSELLLDMENGLQTDQKVTRSSEAAFFKGVLATSLHAKVDPANMRDPMAKSFIGDLNIPIKWTGYES